MLRHEQIRFLVVSLILGYGLPVSGQGVDVDGGQSLEAPKVLQTFGNRGLLKLFRHHRWPPTSPLFRIPRVVSRS